MKIGISTASFYPTEIEQGIQNAADLGFRRIELFVNAESEYIPPLRTALKNQLDALGLQVVSLHPYTSSIEGHLLFSDYARRTQDALDQYARYFEAAAIFGASYFTFHGELLRTRGLPPAQVESRRFETYRALCARAAEYGICFTQENVSWCKSSDLMFLKKLYDNVPELCYTLDIKQAHRAGHTWEDYVDTVGDRIVNLHISDYTEQTDYLLPGQGEVNFSTLFRRLEACGYQGNALVEVYSSDFTALEQLADCRRYLEAVDG